MFRLLCVFLCVTFSPSPSSAQSLDLGDRKKALTQYKIDTWQTEQGLPLNTVQTFLQTRDGYLWVGTGGGLARFDGERFTTFETAEVPGVASHPIFGMMEDAEGNLWIGHSKGAARYVRGRFEVALAADVTAGRRVWAFAQARDGVVWAATENGLVRWHNGATKVYRQSDGLPTNRLRSLTFDKDGTLWIGTTGGGLVSFKSDRFEVMNPSNGFPHLEVRFVLADPSGGVWAATAGGGLARVESGKVVRVYSVRDGLPTDQLTSLTRDGEGSLWIGTWGAGVSRFSGGRFTSIAAAGGLAGDQIWAVLSDREGSVWIGTWVGGMTRLSNRAFVVFGTPEGLSNDNVRSVVHARNGVTWVSTAGGGLNRIEGDRITALGKKEGLPTDETSTLLEDRDGTLWLGTYTAGVARVRQGRIEMFGAAHGLPNVDVRTLLQDRTGTIWVGTRSGLAKFTGKGFVPVAEKGAPQEGVSVMLEDREGTLWFGTPGQGLVSYRDGTFTTLNREQGLVSNWIMALHEDAAGDMWIGTNGEGMNRLRKGRLSAIRPGDGLWDGISQTILEDKTGRLWMTCNRGFYSVPLADLNAFADGRAPRVTSMGFGPGDALRSTTFAGGHQPAGAIDGRGHLWLPSYEGLVIVDPAQLPGSGAPPAAMVEEVSVDGRIAPTRETIELPPGSVPVSIRYTAMTLQNADRARFRYQMDGLTRDWVDAGRNREVSFPALPHGVYQFRVSASLDGQRWSESPEPVTVTVQPHFHETRGFIVFTILGALGGIAGLFRLRTHNLRARHAEMERLVAERTEELRLANEHLSRLSFVDDLTGLANRRRFEETLDKEWRRATRFQTPLSVVIADIDGFKAYNDAIGHPEGDKCLAAVGAVFRQTVSRAGDLAARYGGEEFIVLIPTADHATATAFAERIRLACEARAIPHPASPVGSVVTISLGVASCIPSPQASASAMVADADAALYRAKQEGRNRVR